MCSYIVQIPYIGTYFTYVDSYFAAENATKTFAVAIVEAPGTKVSSAPVKFLKKRFLG